MTDPPESRRRGRPARGAGLTEASIVDAALALLEQERRAFSMRSLARALGADVMALYHYFPTKRALLDAVVLAAFAPLDDVEPLHDETVDLGARLESLAAAYLGIARRYPGLTLEIAAGRISAHSAIDRFDALFARAVRRSDVPDEAVRRAGHVLVDYLHGFLLADRDLGEAWRFGVDLLAQGVKHLPTLDLES